LGIAPNPQSPIPNPQSPIPNLLKFGGNDNNSYNLFKIIINKNV